MGTHLGARVQRVLRLVGVDMLFNGIVRLLSGTLGWWSAVQALHRHVFPLIARSGTRIVDRPREILMMRHDFYAHVEMELFVPARVVVPAAEFLEWVLRSCAGEFAMMPESYPGLSTRMSPQLEALG